MRSIVGRLLILVFTSHVLIGPIASNCQPSVGLAATPARHSSIRFSEPSASWDCTGGGDWGTTILPAHIIDSIKLAEKTLEKCDSCRKIYGDVDPLELLDKIVTKKAIVMATRVPIIRKSMKKGKPKSNPIKPGDAAVVLDLTGRNVDYPRPCVFINATSKSFMAVDILPEDYGLYALPLVEARAVVILHELGHLANKIQRDGEDRTGKKSFGNTICMRQNCMPCAGKYTHCTGMPKHSSSTYNQHLPSPEYWRAALTLMPLLQ